jgi:hypothetical protein
VQGVGPGTVLGSRYALRRSLSKSADLERWSAHDSTLGREVALIIVGAEHPNHAGILDAARRAAGVEDARLVRILDVSPQNAHSFIVEEALNGSESLTTALQRGPLPAEEARRICGETAKALETAGRRGLHHLQLTPHHVVIAPDGAIRVSGVAIAAAIEGPDQQEPAATSSSRRDAVCLVAILYAALTSHWPLDENISGIEPAPRVNDKVASPAQMGASIPDDLNALCEETFNKNTGPTTPVEFANRIAPWPRDRVHRAGSDPTVILRLPRSGDVFDQNENRGSVAQPTTSMPTVAAATRETLTRPAEVAKLTHTATQPHDYELGAAPSAGADVPRDGKGAAATTSGPPGRPETHESAPIAAGTAVGLMSSKLGTFAKKLTRKDAPTQSEPSKEKNFQAGFLGPDDIDPPLPLLPSSTALPPTRGQSKIVLLVVAFFVVLALFLGFHGLIGSLGDASQNNPAAGHAVAGPTSKASASPTPRATISGRPIAIESATGFDPQGDGAENNSQAPNVYDGNPTTTWTSERYTTTHFGNLKKGVGLLLNLGQPTSVHQVTISLANGPLDVTVYCASRPSLQGATVLGSASAASGQVQLKASQVMPNSQYVIIWFTLLAPYGGQYGASVQEIALD